jgi:hypothetical protein
LGDDGAHDDGGLAVVGSALGLAVVGAAVGLAGESVIVVSLDGRSTRHEEEAVEGKKRAQHVFVFLFVEDKELVVLDGTLRRRSRRGHVEPLGQSCPGGARTRCVSVCEPGSERGLPL